ncbi:small membrane protein [Streptomyces sviceus ATCC 29083]|uniref:Small membrane protein n=1 Tax=Streptomyces sviceus (strain ATCC 29083 / DSM 924 / JCM 4929 / NBRC 13980 / NCIMB 11184 / NRRL 5439 / UC 5370) TaxID=463191 RepID=B5HU79_STRX2|nr:small membrane protein [Streptomyces sviceus ATCC 29083]
MRTDHPGYTRAPVGTAVSEAGEAAVAVNGKKLAVYVLVVFVLYVIITDPAKAADYVQIGFQGISDAAKAVGDFFTWLADGAH